MPGACKPLGLKSYERAKKERKKEKKGRERGRDEGKRLKDKKEKGVTIQKSKQAILMAQPRAETYQGSSAGPAAHGLVEGRAADLQLLQVAIRYPDVCRQRQPLIQVLCR